MKSFLLLIPLAAALAGCVRHAGEKESSDTGHEQLAEHDERDHLKGVTFNAKHGLSVATNTAAFIGLKVEDIEERVVLSEFQFSAQIYRAVADARVASTAATAPAVALASGNVSPEDARLVQVGEAVTAQLDSSALLNGRITEVHAHTDKSTDHIDVTLAIDDPGARLAAGMFITIKTPVGSAKPVASVPISALFQTAEGKFVYTASGDYFVRTAVKTGVLNNQFAEVTDGLYAGDRVVTSAAKTLWMAELESVRAGKSCADGH